MRNAYSDTLKVLFHDDLMEAKASHDFTQAQMAERLLMDPRSYIDLDHGKRMGGTLTFVLYLVCLCRDPGAFLSEVAARFTALDHPNVHASPAFQRLLEGASRRAPMPVTRIRAFRNGDSFAVCPGCHTTLEREYQSYCDRCGQSLDWRDYPNAVVIHEP